MPAITPAREAANRESILTAAEELSAERAFKDITLGDIAARTHLSRPSVYNYFPSKEEIFLNLLVREHDLWAEDIAAIDPEQANTREKFAEALAATLDNRELMLKLVVCNFYEMQDASSMDELVRIKKSSWNAGEITYETVKKCLPDMSDDDADGFVIAFFPFIFGLYPYTHLSEKQAEAIKLAEISFEPLSTHAAARLGIERLLR